MSRTMTRPGVVTVELHGGLGNLLFQYAAGFTFMDSFCRTLQFDDSKVPNSDDFKLLIRPTNVITKKAFRRIMSLGRREIPFRIWRRLVRSLLFAIRQVRLKAGRMKLVAPTGAWTPAPHDTHDSSTKVLLTGYFQHPTWFEPSLEYVTSRLWSSLQPYAEQLEPKGATVISVRRGDYVSLNWDLSLEYYSRALEQLGRVDGPVWLTSDDPFAEEFLAPVVERFGLRVEKAPDLGDSSIVRDLAILSAAKTVIMSNSTFCWWGVVTGQIQSAQNPKTVFAPTPWLNQMPESNVLLRPDWITVDASFASK